MLEPRRSAFARHALVLGMTLAALLVSTASPAQARVIDRQRYSDASVVPERICGHRFQVATTFRGIRMTKSSHGDLPARFYDNYDIHEVITNAAGEGFVIDQQGLYTEVRVRHERGTLYRYTAINVGQVFTIRTLDGRAVQRNRGLFEITFLLDTLGDSDPTNDVYLDDSIQLVRDAGVHPIVSQTDAEFCAVVEEAIGG